MATKLVNIVKAFTLTIIHDGQLVEKRIEAGIQRLEEEVAAHWFTEAHSAPVPKGITQTDAEAQADADAEELAKMEAEEKAADDAKAKAAKKS